MKKCLFCAEENQDEDIFCRYCGSRLTDKSIQLGIKPEETKQKGTIEATIEGGKFQLKGLVRPLNHFVYFLIGSVVISIEVLICSIIMVFVFPTSESVDEASYQVVFYLVAGSLFFGSCMIANKSQAGKFIDFGIIMMIILPFIPIIGQSVFIYFIGKGIYMLFSKQNYVLGEAN